MNIKVLHPLEFSAADNDELRNAIDVLQRDFALFGTYESINPAGRRYIAHPYVTILNDDTIVRDIRSVDVAINGQVFRLHTTSPRQTHFNAPDGLYEVFMCRITREALHRENNPNMPKV